MKKITILSFACVMSAFATDASWYLGSELSYQTTELTHDKETKPTIGVKGGKYMSDDSRVYGQLNYGTGDVHTIETGYDYLFTLDNAPIRPFVGASTTFAFIDYGTSKIDGIALNANIGLSYRIKNFDIDAGYGHSIATSGKDNNIELDNLSKFFMGASYRFNSLSPNERTHQEYTQPRTQAYEEMPYEQYSTTPRYKQVPIQKNSNVTVEHAGYTPIQGTNHTYGISIK